MERVVTADEGARDLVLDVSRVLLARRLTGRALERVRGRVPEIARIAVRSVSVGCAERRLRQGRAVDAEHNAVRVGRVSAVTGVVDRRLVLVRDRQNVVRTDDGPGRR